MKRKLHEPTLREEAAQWAEDNAWRFPPDYENNSEHVKHDMSVAYRAGAIAERRRSRAAVQRRA